MELPYVRSFRDLAVYKKMRALSLEIFNLTRSFPKEETYSLTDQIRRSSRSVGAQIAEAWAVRSYEKSLMQIDHIRESLEEYQIDFDTQ